MKIEPFKLERYFAKYEFSAPYLMSCSDCESLTMSELIAMADDESLEMWNNLKLTYTESQGHPVLREEIAKLYKNINKEEVIVLTPEEGIYIAMQTVIESGDHVIVTYPGYQSLYEIANSLGANLSKWLPREDGGLSFDVEDLEKLITDDTKCIVINFPHNPTGTLLKEDEIQQIVKLAKERNITIFSDEMYRFLEYDNKNRTSSLCDLYENAVSLFGMSKSFALPGLRIGWLTTKNKELYKKLATYKDYTTICNNAPSEILAIMALRNKEDIWKRNLKIIKNNLVLFECFVETNGHLIEWDKPIAGPICFPKLKIDINIDEFCKELVEEKGVMLLPASTYDYEGNYFRVGLARINFPEVLNKFKEFLVTRDLIEDDSVDDTVEWADDVYLGDYPFPRFG